MCLYLGGGDDCLRPQFPPTAQATMHKSRLQLVGLCHIMLALAILFNNGPNSLQMIMTAAILFCASMSLNYCCLLIYILYTMVDFVTIIDPIGRMVQNNIQSRGTGWQNSALTWLYVACLIFEPIAIYYAFLGYREFKAGLQEAGSSVGMGPLGGTGAVGQAARTTGDQNYYNGNSTAYGNAPAASGTQQSTSGGFRAFQG